MSDRMAKLDRLLALVHALAEDSEGLTLDEMAARLEVSRRTAERMRNILMLHFDLEPIAEGRTRRWRIAGRLSRMFVRPTAHELAALKAEAEARAAAGQQARASQLASLLAKVRSAMDAPSRLRAGPDLEALTRAQRILVPAGPAEDASPESMAAAQGAIIAGAMLEFDYRARDQSEPRWRRVIPYGLLHGPMSYLVGAIPGREDAPLLFRLHRMANVAVSEQAGIVPEDFRLDEWLAQSFGLWRDPAHEIVLRVGPAGAAAARDWRFHPKQSCTEQADGGLEFRFRAGGLRELAEHLFGWGEGIEIVAPRELRALMVAMLEETLAHHRGGERG